MAVVVVLVVFVAVENSLVDVVATIVRVAWEFIVFWLVDEVNEVTIVVASSSIQ